MKNLSQNYAPETVCCVDNLAVASKNAANCEVREVLSPILRDRVQMMLQAAIQKEVDDYLQNRSGTVGEDGRRLVIRNGPLPERQLITGLGLVQLRARDKLWNCPMEADAEECVRLETT